MKKNNLKVKPLKRYKTPKYPSYLDKNPIEYPETLPYPFRAKVLHGLLMTGIFTSMTFGASPQNGTVPQNPFSFAATALPHTPASFGTGLPSQLSQKEARSAIFKVFEKEGISLQKDYLYKKNGQEYLLDGYNEEKHIGFAWLHWNNLNPDNFNHYHGAVPISSINLGNIIRRSFNVPNELREKYQTKYEVLVSNKQPTDKIFEELKYEVIAAYIIADRSKADESFRKKSNFIVEKAKEAFKLPKEKQTAAFEYVVLRFDIDNFPSKSYSSAKSLHNELVTYSDYLRINAHTFSLEELRKYHTIAKKLIGIITHSRVKEKTITFLSKSFKKFEKDRNIDAYFDAINSIDSERFSLEEVKYTEQQAIENKEFIAPISSYNRGFQYRYAMGEWSLDREVRKQIVEETNKIEDDVERKKAYEAAMNRELEKRPDPKQKVLTDLESQVRNYIRWAKSQGMY